MNENLNLVEILKDCPQGTKLYSIMHGEVEFEQIKYNSDYSIVFKFKNEEGNYYMDTTTIDGKFKVSPYGECTLFPSKDQRDWSKFSIEPKFDISTLQPFDKVLVRDHHTQKWKCDFYDRYEKQASILFRTIYSWYAQCIPYNDETKHLVGTTKMPPKKYITWEE